MEELENRCKKAAKEYLKSRGYEVIDCYGEFIVAKEEKRLVFIHVVWVEDTFAEAPNPEQNRTWFEDMAWSWLDQCHDENLGQFRFDQIVIRPTKDKTKAVPEHFINCLGAGGGKDA